MTTTNNPPVTHNPVDEYFWKLDQELLAKQRRQRAMEREAQEREAAQKSHWMKCPKCGQDLQETDFKDIKIDRCTGCGGAFFDAGELDLLRVRNQHQNWLAGFLAESLKT
jgi:uncharacterized protein